ncbi:MAG TPA: thioredoxin domain-containing protein [Candidatus Acidoferrales bacterium]|nr:thioredoxin domain-containing protein [Candidatus Acidoferrales bacterium]
MRFVALALALAAPAFTAGPDVDKGKAMGNPSAPITLELYSDFMCPHCKHLHEDILPAIVMDFVKTGKAYLVFREFPLNIPQHVYSRPAANFAVAAARIGKYQAVCDALFKSQQQWGTTGKVWETVATALTPEEQRKVQALAQDPSVLAEVQKDYDLGMRSQVNQTPTVIVTYKLKQQPWSFWDDYNLFKGYLDGLLKK